VRTSLLTVALVLGLELASPTAALAQRSPQTTEGYALLEKGWVNDAIAAFQAALRQQPNSPEARLGLAIAYQRAGRDADAWNAYRAVLAVRPNDGAALAAIGELGGYRPEWQADGIAALSQLLGQNPENVAARRQRALLYGYQGRFSQAIADYEPLLAQNPAPETLLGAAQVYAYSGDYPAALALFERYGSVGAVPPQALPAYALALRESGAVPAAIALLEPALRGPEPTADLRVALAIAYDASGQSDRALALLEPLGDAPGDRLARARVYSAIARRQQNAALFEQALDLYRQVLAATPAPSYGLRGEVADGLSEGPATLAEAQALVQQLAEENPALVSWAVQERLLAYRLGQVEAQAVADQLTAMLTPLPGDRPELRAIATALVRVENPDLALLPVYEAVASAVTSPPLTYRLAQLYLGQGQPEAARAAYRAAIEVASPGVESDQLSLGYALVAYRTGTISAAEATETLERWLASQSLENPPPELVELVGALPASADRAELYQGLLAQRPGDLGLRWRSIQLLAQVNPAQAQAELAELAAAYPQAIAVDFFQAELAQTLGDLEAAAAAYQRVLAQEPENLAALRALAGVEFQRDDLPAARALYRQVLARDPNDWQARYAIAELDLARDQKLAGLEQLRQIPTASAPANLEERARDVEFDLLRRRGFQPDWERY
jgi:tetratricopeptide (TPR) repeat protein